jgi:Uma2 family endonuclease
MASAKPRGLIEVRYEAAAQEYLRNLPPEHFMEAIGQSTQREITLESLALVRARRPDFHVFKELLVQYERPGERKPGQVCPDNMVVLSKKPIHASTSYNLPLEPARPFWVLEYVSKSNKRKDYDDNVDKYEKELQVPYYLIFYPETQDLALYCLELRRYVSIQPNKQGRYPIRKVNIEVALLDGWVRYWYQGKLLPLPGELQSALDSAQREAAEARREAEREKQRRQDLERELAQVRALIEQQQPRGGNGNRAKRR